MSNIIQKYQRNSKTFTSYLSVIIFNRIKLNYGATAPKPVPHDFRCKLDCAIFNIIPVIWRYSAHAATSFINSFRRKSKTEILLERIVTLYWIWVWVELVLGIAGLSGGELDSGMKFCEQHLKAPQKSIFNNQLAK